MKNSGKLTKKIIAGKYKATVLDLPPKSNTRSSKTIVLESFFNTLQFDITDAVFIELFAGSGSIGLEALSRGAQEIVFMEQNSAALHTLKQNIAKTDPFSCTVIAGDTFTNIQTVCSMLQKQGKDAYFYIDPPFSIRDGMEDIYMKMISLIEQLPKEIVRFITIEHMTAIKLPQSIGVYSLQKQKKFGKTTLSYFL
jgi:16S rRNA (guanine966-N2)-methyltransferase